MNKFVDSFRTITVKYNDFTKRHFLKIINGGCIIGGTSGFLVALDSESENYEIVACSGLIGLGFGGIIATTLPTIGPSLLVSSMIAFPVYKYINYKKENS